jgi:hypothetical protein
MARKNLLKIENSKKKKIPIIRFVRFIHRAHLFLKSIKKIIIKI